MKLKFQAPYFQSKALHQILCIFSQSETPNLDEHQLPQKTLLNFKGWGFEKGSRENQAQASRRRDW